MKITFLGTGTSCGVPLPTCQCEVCQSPDPHDHRLRCSALVETDEGCQILIDCGPDFRLQAIENNIMHLDAVLLTHNHFDHCFGIDDLRAYSFKQPLPLFVEPSMANVLRQRHDYIFVHKYPGTPKLELNEVNPGETFIIGNTECRAIRVYHKFPELPILAFRIGQKLAYVTDCSLIPDDQWQYLEGIDTLIIDALRWKEHPTHFSVEQALEVVNRLKPRQTWFTHMSHDMGLHDWANNQLPNGVKLAYDGQVCEC
ncbi:MAG: MBL fold metallo-hydrolase [Bacteroidales bacterium]|nr:MBL fold metallo-hydrolase [Bacteroidales bacterium]